MAALSVKRNLYVEAAEIPATIGDTQYTWREGKWIKKIEKELRAEGVDENNYVYSC